jgi:molecular chaperone HscA
MAKISINLNKGTVEKAPAQAPLIVGIDLGTTNSLVAYVKDGQPLAVKDSSGKNTLMPSVIHFPTEGGQPIVGLEALLRMVAAPEDTIFSVKRLMGKSYQDVREYEGFFSYKIIDEPNQSEQLVKIRVGDRFYTPVELSAQILSALKQRIEANLGRTVQQAVITVPAYFNDAQRQATRDAGKLAGWDVLRIINEPTAASLAYGLGLAPDEQKTVAVYDLGGGTFDISILKIENQIFEVCATNGDTFLGGDDFDRVLVQHWKSQYNLGDLSRTQTQALRLLAEEAKKQLSSAEEFQGQFQGQTLAITRQAFEVLIAPLVERTLQACRYALQDAKLLPSEIDEVILVGGSTRVPLVKEKVKAFFGRPANDAINPDEAVALGAAIQADILAGNQKGMLLLDVTPLSLGIETMGGLMDVIIPRNTKIPIRAARQYTTSVDGQVNLKVSVYQGERDLVQDNRLLGEFILRGIPPMPAGLPKIEIQFWLDADGILKVKAMELRSNIEQTVEMRSMYRLSEADMAKMLLESVQNAQSDMQKRGLIEARNEAQTVLLASKKFLEQNADWLSPAESQGFINHVNRLQKSVEGEDKDAIQKAMDEINAYAQPLAQIALDRNIAQAVKGTKIM